MEDVSPTIGPTFPLDLIKEP